MVLHTTYVLRVPYSCGIVLVFWFWREIVFGVMYVLSVQYSCVVVSFFCFGGKANLVRIFFLNPNFLHVHRNKYLEGMDDGQKTPRGHPDFHSYVKLNVFHIPDIFLVNTLLLYSLSPYSQTERQMESHTRYAWAGGTIFPVVLLCQFLVLLGNRFWFYILLMYLEYHTRNCDEIPESSQRAPRAPFNDNDDDFWCLDYTVKMLIGSR